MHMIETYKPVPKDNEILVRVSATTVSSGTLWARSGKHPDSKIFTFAIRLMFGLRKPRKKNLGYEFSGEVEAVGKDVALFRINDKVFGTTTGLKFGAYAEYLCLPEDRKQGVVAIKPENISHDEAAAVPCGAMAALYVLRKANISKGQKVLIYGASGSVGTYAVQLASCFGSDVTAVCSSSNLELVASLGAHKVIDYTKEDFTGTPDTYDVVFDAVGKLSRSSGKKVLKKNGCYLSIKSPTSEKTENLLYIKELIETGKIRPVIDRSYPLEHTAEAHAYSDGGHKKGNVVITIDHKSDK
jgi:NADPH:quinone reductase-like Zn-dependent oxidoreductase